MLKIMVGTMMALTDVLKNLFYRLWEAVEADSSEKKYRDNTFRKNILKAIKVMVCNTEKFEVQKHLGRQCNSLKEKVCDHQVCL